MKTLFTLIAAIILLPACQLLSPAMPSAPKVPAPSNLRVELLQGASVSNVRDELPEFSWVLASNSLTNKQLAYQIQLTKTNAPFDNRTLTNRHKNQKLVWDSGKISATDSIAQAYNGPLLQAGQHYQWRVRVWTASTTNQENISPWSTPQRFTMANKLDKFASYHELTYSAIKPVSTTTLPNGRILLDFGKVAFGYLELALTAKYAGMIDIHFGERGHASGEQQGIISQLHRGSSVRYYQVPLDVNAKHDVYAVHPPKDKRNTKTKAIAIPGRFGRIAPFRFVEIDPQGLDIKNISASLIAVHYPWHEHQSSFSSSDQTLNAVWELCKYSIKATSFAGIYVDGDRERIPYEADAYINQLSHYFVDSEYSIARRSHDYLMANPTWPTEWKQHSVMMAWADWRYTGDIDSLKAHYFQLKQQKTLERFAGNNQLLTTYPTRNMRVFMGDIVDWPPAERDGYQLKKVNTVVNAFYYLNLKQMAEMAAALGKPHEASYYQNKAKAVYSAFNKHFFDQQTGLYIDGIGTNHSSAHANIAPLAFGLVPEQHKAKIISFIKNRGMAVSVYFAQYLMEALYLNGEADYALSLLTSKGERSWYNMIRAGSTITMEAWDDKFKRNQDWNHAWGAVPANIIGRFILGVEPASAGLKTISIKPQPASLTFVEGYVPTIRGQVFVGIKQDIGKSFSLDVSIPGNTQGLVTLPVKHNQQIEKLTVNGKQLSFQQVNDGVSIAPLSAGWHKVKLSFKQTDQ